MCKFNSVSLSPIIMTIHIVDFFASNHVVSNALVISFLVPHKRFDAFEDHKTYNFTHFMSILY